MNQVLAGPVGLAGGPQLAEGLLRVRPVEDQPSERRAGLEPRFAEGLFAPRGVAGFSSKTRADRLQVDDIQLGIRRRREMADGVRGEFRLAFPIVGVPGTPGRQAGDADAGR